MKEATRRHSLQDLLRFLQMVIIRPTAIRSQLTPLRRLALLLLFVPLEVHAADVTVSIKKIDPATPITNAQFKIVVLVANSTVGNLDLALSCRTDTTSRKIWALQAGSSEAIEMTGQ